MQARRDSLKSVKVSEHTHAGLWLDKFLTDQTEEGKKDEKASQAKAKLIKELCDINVPDGYQAAFARRESLFTDLKEKKRANYCAATVEGRMIIGLGQKGPVEAGLALEHTWGVPMIPGSALKGLTMAAAHLLLEDEAWRKGVGHSLKILGGTTERIGSVIFHDAWWIPEQDKLPIHPDVMTVHHPDYYKDGNKAPSDMDSPIPIPFASVTGNYLVVVERTFPLKAEEQEDVLEAALYILKLGLAHLGIGAKTNAGYGRMTLDYKSQTSRELEELRLAVTRVESSSEGRLSAFDQEPFAELIEAVPGLEADLAAKALEPIFKHPKLQRKRSTEIGTLRSILSRKE